MIENLYWIRHIDRKWKEKLMKWITKSKVIFCELRVEIKFFFMANSPRFQFGFQFADYFTHSFRIHIRSKYWILFIHFISRIDRFILISLSNHRFHNQITMTHRIPFNITDSMRIQYNLNSLFLMWIHFDLTINILN